MSHLGRMQSDQEYVRRTSDYNEDLLHAVIAGTARRRDEKKTSPKQKVTKPQQKNLT